VADLSPTEIKPAPESKINLALSRLGAVTGWARNGQTDMASALRSNTVGAIETEGFAKYFDPITGEAPHR
jgi:hypothetical protein